MRVKPTSQVQGVIEFKAKGNKSMDCFYKKGFTFTWAHRWKKTASHHGIYQYRLISLHKKDDSGPSQQGWWIVEGHREPPQFSRCLALQSSKRTHLERRGRRNRALRSPAGKGGQGGGRIPHTQRKTSISSFDLNHFRAIPWIPTHCSSLSISSLWLVISNATLSSKNITTAQSPLSSVSM